MSALQLVSDLPNFPYGSFSEFQIALKQNEVGIGIDRYMPFQLVSRGAVSKGGYWFSTIVTWCWLWAVAPFLFVVWPTLGWWSLGMFVVGIGSAIFSRPWSSTWLVLFIIGATVYGFVANQPFVGWYGVAWTVVWFIICGMYNWCQDEVMRRLEVDEQFFIKLWPTKGVSLRLKSGERIWCDVYS